MITVTLAWGETERFPESMVEALEVWDRGIAVVLKTGEAVTYLRATVAAWRAPIRKIHDRLSGQIDEDLLDILCVEVAS